MRSVIPIALCLGLCACQPGASTPDPTSSLSDGDGDGFLVTVDDCDDSNSQIHPGADEGCDGVDNDCDGLVDEGADWDADGVPVCAQGGVAADCDDRDASIRPGAPEIPYDGIDQDCDGVDLTDVDGDGWRGIEAGGLDCDDEDPAIHPEQVETPYDGIDQDCDGADLTDVDGDGFDATASGGPDCDDQQAEVNPDGAEVIDGLDNDCDGLIDRVALTDARVSWIGEYAEDRAGASIAEVGDVNGDGLPDLAVGAPGADGAATDSGKVYLLLGRSALGSGEIDLSYADVTFTGISEGERAGAFVAGIGDLDGDGIGDLAIVAPGPEDGVDVGRIYLIFGRSEGWPTRVSLLDADGVLTGLTPGDGLGMTATAAGDVNGDGLPDMAFGAPSFDDPGLTAAGPAFDKGAVGIVYGATQPPAEGEEDEDNPWIPPVWDRDLLGADQLWLGEDEDALAGASLAAVGDLTGDHRSDLVIGSPGMPGDAGAPGGAYVLFGRAEAPSATPSLASADVRFIGRKDGDRAGTAIAAGLDVSGDGWPDLIVGAPGVSAGAGALYVFLGKPSGLARTLAVGDADATWAGQSPGLHAGAALAFGLRGAGLPADLWMGIPGMEGPPGPDGIPGLGAVALLPAASIALGGAVEDASMVVFGLAEEGMGTTLAQVTPHATPSPSGALVGLPGDGRGGDGGGAAALVMAP